MDILDGKVKTMTPIGGGTVPSTKAPRNGKALPNNLTHAAHIMKPQLKFQEPVDNSNTPFIPKLTSKPNAKVPLQLEKEAPAIPDAFKDHIQDLGLIGPQAEIYKNPYEYEIRHVEYPDHLLQHRTEILFAPLDKTPFTWVDTEEALNELAHKLDEQKEIAIDLEAHEYRSYQGLTCLMQVSTRDEDFVVDTLALRHHMHILNSSFTNEKIVKVWNYKIESLKITYFSRFSMVHIWMFCGCRGTLACIWSIYLIPTMLPMHWNSVGTHLRI